MSPAFRRGLGLGLGLTAVTLALGVGVRSAESAGEDFEARSVALRTLLHHDSAQERAFRGLLTLYRQAGRETELRALYEGHLSRYPADAGARAVWIRLLVEGEDPEAAERAREAAREYPEDAWFQYLEYEATGRLEALERAVALENVEAKRLERLRELAAVASGENERALAEAAWRRELVARSGQSVDAVRELAVQARGAGFLGLAWEASDRAWDLGPSGEAEVELALEDAAWAEADQDETRQRKVRERLASLRERLAADHPRRGDVVLGWWRLGGQPKEAREEAVAAWRADPTVAARGVDAALLSEAEERYREAAELWLELAEIHPGWGDSVDRGRELLRDDAEGWIAFLDRLVRRDGVEERWVRERIVLEFRTAGQEAGQRRLEDSMRSLEPAEEGRFLVALGEELLGAGLPAAAADCFGRAETGGSGGFPALAGRIRALAASRNGSALRAALAEWKEGSGSEEEWLSLAAHLEESGWEPEAADLIRRASLLPGAGVAVRLSRLEMEGGEDTGERLEAIRQEAVSAEDYRRWLISMATWWAGQGQADEAWRREASHLAEEITLRSGESVGRWTVFAEVARARSQGARLRQLADAAVPSRAALAELPAGGEVRRLVAEAWEADPGRILDAEPLLLSLEQDDPARSDEYRARLTLLAERSRRRDLALERLQTVDGDKLADPELLRPLAELAADAGLGTVERTFRARLVALVPEDATAWERHLAVLRREGDEAGFRSAAASLLAPNGILDLGAEARQTLQDGVFASWQRELASAAPERRQILLRALLRDRPSEEVRAWAEACQAWERGRTGGGAETEAASGLEDREMEIGQRATVNWAVLAAIGRGWSADSGKPDIAEEPVRSLVGPGWVFRCRPDRRVRALCAGEGRLLVVDDRWEVQALDARSGKLIWVRPGPVLSGRRANPSERDGKESTSGDWDDVTVPPALVAWGGLVFTADDRMIIALEEQSGRPVWEATFGSGGVTTTPTGRVRCPIRLARAEGGRLVALIPESDRLAALDSRTGKVVWSQETFPGMASRGPLGCGLAAGGPIVAVLGDRLAVHGAADGRRAWSRVLGDPQNADLDGVREVEDSVPEAASAVREIALDGKRLLALDGERGFLFDAAFPGPGTSWKQSGSALVGFRGDTVVWAGEDGLEVTGAANGEVRFRVAGPGPGGWFGRHIVWGTGDGFASYAAGSGRRGWRSLAEDAGDSQHDLERFVAAGCIRSERSGGRVVRHLVPVRAVASAGGMAWIAGAGTEVKWWRGESES